MASLALVRGILKVLLNGVGDQKARKITEVGIGN
jgi:hypothetical protein